MQSTWVWSTLLVIAFSASCAFAQFDLEKLTASDMAAGDEFGFVVAIDSPSSGPRRVIVGAPFKDIATVDEAGKAYIIEDGSGGWDEVAILSESSAEDDDRFGSSVGISGDYAIVGMPLLDDGTTDGAGAAFIFERDSNGDWDEITPVELRPHTGANFDNFGVVAIPGTYAVVGSPHDDDAAGSAGAVYVFEEDGQGGWDQVAKFTGSDAAQNDTLGSSVAISGDYIIAGAPHVASRRLAKRTSSIATAREIGARLN